MVICADTSFLFSLYGNDCHSPSASAWIAGSHDPIRISVFNDFEFRNSLRFAEFRKVIKPGSAKAYLELFENAIELGRLLPIQCNAADILLEANHLSAVHTLGEGHRAMDILHVACAFMIGATHFLTFDANQKKLAEKGGLTVPP